MEIDTLKYLVEKFAYRYREEPFELSAGGKSHHYFNMKELTMRPDVLFGICELMTEVIDGIGENIQGIGGLTMGADPMVYGLAQILDAKDRPIYPLIVRKEPKGHGTGKLIEGVANHVARAICIEDVSTTGASALKAVKAMREVGIECNHVITILDRQEGAAKNMEAEGVQLHSLFTKSEFGVGD